MEVSPTSPHKVRVHSAHIQFSHIHRLFPFSSIVSAHNITFTGAASVAAYEQALRLVTYQNTAPEPHHSQRQLTFQVSDGQFVSNVLQGAININLTDDNPLQLVCGSGSVGFTEGSNAPMNITHELTLSDLDVNHIVTSARVEIENAQEGDRIAVSPPSSGPLTVVNVNDTMVEITGESQVTEYQVKNMIPEHYSTVLLISSPSSHRGYFAHSPSLTQLMSQLGRPDALACLSSKLMESLPAAV